MDVSNSYTDEVLKYSKEMDESERMEYVNRVYKFVIDMKPGQKATIAKIVKAENVDLFVAVVKMMILESGWAMVEFVDDYRVILRILFTNY